MDKKRNMGKEVALLEVTPGKRGALLVTFIFSDNISPSMIVFLDYTLKNPLLNFSNSSIEYVFHIFIKHFLCSSLKLNYHQMSGCLSPERGKTLKIFEIWKQFSCTILVNLPIVFTVAMQHLLQCRSSSAEIIKYLQVKCSSQWIQDDVILVILWW